MLSQEAVRGAVSDLRSYVCTTKRSESRGATMFAIAVAEQLSSNGQEV